MSMQSKASKTSKATTAQGRVKVEVGGDDDCEELDSDDDNGPQRVPKVTDSWTRRHSMQSLTQPFLHPWFDDYKMRKGLNVPWTKTDLERGSHVLWAHKAAEIGWAISMSECRELARAWLDRWHRGTRPAGFAINNYKIYKAYDVEKVATMIKWKFAKMKLSKSGVGIKSNKSSGKDKLAVPNEPQWTFYHQNVSGRLVVPTLDDVIRVHDPQWGQQSQEPVHSFFSAAAAAAANVSEGASSSGNPP